MTDHLGQFIQKPLYNLRELLSECAMFQSLTGSADAEEALTRIHYGYAENENGRFPEQAQKPLPRITLFHSALDAHKSGVWNTSFELGFQLDIEVPAEDRKKARGVQWFNTLGPIEQIHDELKLQADAGTRLNLSDLDMIGPPHLETPQKNSGIDREVCVTRWGIGVQT